MMKCILIALILWSGIMADYNFKIADLELVRDHPHKLGHLVGKTKLTEMHSKWIRAVWDDHKSLQGHRGSYKTTAITHIGGLRNHLINPDDCVAVYRKPFTQAARATHTIRKFYDLPQVKALFNFAHGAVPRVTRDRRESYEFSFKIRNTDEGSLDAYGVEKMRTGSHYDVALCDDFVTLEDRISKAEREKTKIAIMELVTNIINPGCPVMFVGTPWHKKDSWSLVKKEILKFTIHDTDILSAIEIADKKSTTTDSLFACNYLLKHIANIDAIFSDPIRGKWDRSLVKVYGHLDAKYKGDHTNGLTFMAKLPDGRIQAVGFTSSVHVDDWQDFIKQKYQAYHCKRLYGEENADKGYLAKELRTKHMNVETYNEKMTKHVKIETFLKKYWNQIVWAEETEPEYLVQITDWMEGLEPDDCPDSASSLLQRAFYPDSSNALWEL